MLQTKDTLLWALLQRKLFSKYRGSKRFYLLKQSMNYNSPFKCSKARITLFPEKSEQLDMSKAMLQKQQDIALLRLSSLLLLLTWNSIFFVFQLIHFFLLSLSCLSAQVFFFDGIFLLHSTSSLFLIPGCLSMSVTHFPYM